MQAEPLLQSSEVPFSHLMSTLMIDATSGTSSSFLANSFGPSSVGAKDTRPRHDVRRCTIRGQRILYTPLWPMLVSESVKGSGHRVMKPSYRVVRCQKYNIRTHVSEGGEGREE